MQYPNHSHQLLSKNLFVSICGGSKKNKNDLNFSLTLVKREPLVFGIKQNYMN